MDRGRLGTKTRRGVFLSGPGLRPARLRDIRDAGGREHQVRVTAASIDGGAVAGSPWGYHGQRGITAAFRLPIPRSTAHCSRRPSRCRVRRWSSSRLIDYHGVDAPAGALWRGLRPPSCRHGSQSGWFVLTMPVDDRDGVRRRPVDRLPKVRGRSHRARGDGRRVARPGRPRGTRHRARDVHAERRRRAVGDDQHGSGAAVPPPPPTRSRSSRQPGRHAPLRAAAYGHDRRDGDHPGGAAGRHGPGCCPPARPRLRRRATSSRGTGSSFRRSSAIRAP